jgi:glycosyltransferase involved in cell wall biosynthesis
LSKSMKQRTLSVIVPAFNEEANITKTLETIHAASRTTGLPVEIIAINDASKDKTLELIRASAKKRKNIRVIDNKVNRGFGYNVLMGIRLAKKEYSMMIPGDNEVSSEAIVDIFRRVKKTDKDLIIPYFYNSRIRPFFRRVISRIYVMIFNFLFGLNLRYYNGTVVYKSSLIKKLPISNATFSYQAEIVVKLVKSGYSYEAPGVKLQERIGGKSTALRLKNFLALVSAVARLWWLMNVKQWRFKV